MATFKTKFGTQLHDTALPAQSNFEGFEERLASGQLRAEQLTQVVSVREQEEQESKKPDVQRHMTRHLDGQLTIQTKRRFLSSMPANPGESRVKYNIMTHCWLFAQILQPGRHLHSDFTRMTFIDFLDELLSGRNFLMDETIGDSRVVRSDWSLCMRYELELRREAIKYTRERGMAIQEALWPAYHDEHHRLGELFEFPTLIWFRILIVDRQGQDSSATSEKSCRLGKTNTLSLTSRSQAATGSSRSSKFFVQSVGLSCSTNTKSKAGMKGKGKGKNKHINTGHLKTFSLSSSSWTCLMKLVRSLSSFPRMHQPQLRSSSYLYWLR